MKELIGLRCTAVFNLPDNQWPIAGYPAWVIVDAVDMPMVKMRSMHAGAPLWINAAVIQTISPVEQRRERAPWWARLLSGPTGDVVP